MAYEFDRAFDLAGKTAIVTGASRGIGRAVADLFAAHGANQVLVGVKPLVKEIPAALPGGAARNVAVVADVSDAGAVDAVVAAAVSRFGGVDIVVNNAGITAIAKAEETSEADWDRVLAVNLKGAWLVAKAAAKVMIPRRWGRIVNVASMAGVVGVDRHVAYCASKAGMIHMTRVMALEWAQHGITANAVSPTIVETDMGRTVWAGEVGEAAKRGIPVGRFLQPEEVAAAVLYLVSGVAGMINGENLVMDGGVTAR